MSAVAPTRIVLLGPMGAGKTTVGKALAARCSLPFADLDARIEEQAGMTIPQIFASAGEARFREWEREVVDAWCASPEGGVLALGGGAYVQRPVRERLRSAGALACYLRVPAGVGWSRVRSDATSVRPLIEEGGKERYEAILASRAATYELADAIVEADGSVEAVVDAIVAEVAHA